MQDTDLLQTIAEIAIALTGFTGVVGFLGNQSRDEWRAVDLLRFKNLINNSIAALLLSFTPILIFKLGASEPTTWRWSSGLIAAYLLISTWLASRSIRHLPEDQRVEIAPPALAAIFLTVSAVVALLTTNAMGIAYVGESGPAANL